MIENLKMWYRHTKPSSAETLKKLGERPLPDSMMDPTRTEGAGISWVGISVAKAAPMWHGVSPMVQDAPAPWKEPWKYGVLPTWPQFTMLSAMYLLEDDEWEEAKGWVGRLTAHATALNKAPTTLPTNSQLAAREEDVIRTIRLYRWISHHAPQMAQVRFLSRSFTLAIPPDDNPQPTEE